LIALFVARLSPGSGRGFLPLAERVGSGAQSRSHSYGRVTGIAAIGIMSLYFADDNGEDSVYVAWVYDRCIHLWSSPVFGCVE
jgi:hypothetical protein